MNKLAMFGSNVYLRRTIGRQKGQTSNVRCEKKAVGYQPSVISKRELWKAENCWNAER